MIPFTFYLTPILHLIYSLSISSYDASLQAHDHSLRTFFANIVQEHVYCKELNIRSLPKNIENMQHFLERLHYKFTIITFTETWLAEYNSSLHNFIDNSHVYKLRDKKRRGGGVSMFIDSRINYQDQNDINIDI